MFSFFIVMRFLFAKTGYMNKLANTKIYHWNSIKSLFSVQISIQWQTLDKLFDFFNMESKSHEWDLFKKSQILYKNEF